jgi:C4-dicarboxylate-specific signal transduction histidine kinase
MMLVLALTGLAIGVVVDERRRAELRLRVMQDAQARLTRLGSFNELSAAIAHEINQPLSAATTYARVAAEALQVEDGGRTSAREAVQKSMAQVQRAAEVVRRIRQLMRSGMGEPSKVEVAPLIRDAIELAGIARLARGVDISVSITPHGLHVSADVLQAQQVLINLLRNSVEALDEAESADRRILIEAQRGERGMVEFIVKDTGPGFRDEQLADPFQPFVTTKLDGLGIGLSLCRTIIEANGGWLAIANSRSGAVVRFALPEAVESDGEKEDLRRSDR